MAIISDKPLINSFFDSDITLHFTFSHNLDNLPACLLTCLLACLPAFLPACFPACFLACPRTLTELFRMLLELISNVLLNNITDGHTHKILTPWAPVGIKKINKAVSLNRAIKKLCINACTK